MKKLGEDSICRAVTKYDPYLQIVPKSFAEVVTEREEIPSL